MDDKPSIVDNIEALDRLALAELQDKNVRKLDLLKGSIKLLSDSIRLKPEENEEKYILAKRLIYLIQNYVKLEPDKKYAQEIYRSEFNKAESLIEKIRPILIKRYEDHNKLIEKQREKQCAPEKKEVLDTEDTIEMGPIFRRDFITCGELYKAIEDNKSMLLIDIRSSEDFETSKIEFMNIINIPEDCISKGLSAHRLGSKLTDNTQTVWKKRNDYSVLIMFDWNSNENTISCSKLVPLKSSIVDWDMTKYRQHPVILSGGFKDFLETYPSKVTNVFVNLPRMNEEVDELLELDDIVYPENTSSNNTNAFKQFTIDNMLEENEDINVELKNEENEAIDEKSLKNKENHDKILGGHSTDTIYDTKHIIEDYDFEYEEKIDEPKPDDDFSEEAEEIKKRIEDQKNRLLIAARNAKPVPYNATEGPEGDINTFIRPPQIYRSTKPDYSRDHTGWCGLVNIRNTCYMNTILQCLKCLPIMRTFLNNDYQKYLAPHPARIAHEFVATLQEIWKGSEYSVKIYRPSAFYEKVCKLDSMYRKGNHEDCMEFFLFLFNHLNEDFLCDIKRKLMYTEIEKSWYSYLQGSTSMWVDYFYHQLQCTKICQKCKNETNSYEMDNTLMLPVPVGPILSSVHLRDLITEYMSDNLIMDYKCSKCKDMRVLSRKRVVTSPEVLIIVLKRYFQDEYQETRKNNVPVNFDLKLQFGDFSYNLSSVAEHRGTMTHGHYFAHGFIREKWLEFNDERVSRLQDWSSITSSVCAFFYSKQPVHK